MIYKIMICCLLYSFTQTYAMNGGKNDKQHQKEEKKPKRNRINAEHLKGNFILENYMRTYLESRDFKDNTMFMLIMNYLEEHKGLYRALKKILASEMSDPKITNNCIATFIFCIAPLQRCVRALLEGVSENAQNEMVRRIIIGEDFNGPQEEYPQVAELIKLQNKFNKDMADLRKTVKDELKKLKMTRSNEVVQYSPTPADKSETTESVDDENAYEGFITGGGQY